MTPLRADADFRALVHAMPEGVLVHRRGPVLYANPAMARITGHATGDDLVGLSVLHDLVHEEDRSLLLRRMTSIGEEALPPAQVRVVRADGSRPRLVEGTAVVIPFEGDAAIGVVLRDLTENQDALRRASLAERLASLGTLAAGTAHELNSPLAFILANLDYLQDELAELLTAHPKGAELRAALEESHQGARRAAEIVGALKAFARAPDLAPADVAERSHLARAARGALRLAENDLRHRATLAVELTDVPPVAISETALVQILVNLLVNASHAFPLGGAPGGVVEVRTRVDGDRACVVVADDGIGMSTETQRRIFDPFFTTKEPGHGTGLGLSIAYRLVRDAGGDIEVLSAPGEGTTMTVWLPLADARAAAPEREVPRPIEGLRLLIIDDDPLVARGLRRRLRGCDVAVQTSPEEALELASTGTFDAILCDVMMPGMDGVAFHEALRRRSPEAAQRVVLMTGGGLHQDVAALVERAGRPVLEKPFAMDQLAAAVATLGGEAQRVAT